MTRRAQSIVMFCLVPTHGRTSWSQVNGNLWKVSHIVSPIALDDATNGAKDSDFYRVIFNTSGGQPVHDESELHDFVK